MKIIRVKAKNIMRLTTAELQLEGHYLYLVGGKNDSGKTSTLTAIQIALCGKRGMDYPEVPLQEGQKEGWVELDLSGDDEIQQPEGIRVERHFTRTRSGTVVDKLRILDTDGNEAPEPQTLLNRLYKSRGFDPLAFEKMPAKQQRDVLVDVLGLDTSELDAEYQKLFNERTLVNRAGKELKARYDKMEKHTDVPKEEVSVKDLAKQLNDARAVRANADALSNDIDRYDQQRTQFEKDIADLEKQIADKQAAIKAVDEAKTAAKEELDGMELPDVGELEEQMINAEDVNRRVRDNQKREEVSCELTQMRSKAEDLNNRIREIVESKEKMMEEADWPVENMSFDEDGLLYEGLPFDQAAKSVRIRTSVKMGMAMNPKLRVLICQDGNDLDNESLEELQKLLEENDFQMILERVTRGPEDEARCQVVIEDGRQVEKDTAKQEELFE